MDGVTKFLDYSRVPFCPSQLPPTIRPTIRELERNLRVGHTTFLNTPSLSSSIALFPLAPTGKSDLYPELWVHEFLYCASDHSPSLKKGEVSTDSRD
jgi:hypothetical protein